MKPRTLILASSSPFRRQLLERLMVPFESISPNIDESAKAGETPTQLVERLAIEKARAIAASAADALVIGSDQVAVHDGHIVGKPHTHARAAEQLRAASGQRVELYTGLALLNCRDQSIQSTIVPFATQYKNLSDETIEAYLRKEQPYDCAGSLKSEGLGIALLERFEGDDPTALIGLPLIALVNMLERAGYPVLQSY